MDLGPKPMILGFKPRADPVAVFIEIMQVPKRKPGKYTNEIPDPHLTEEKFFELKNKLEKLKKDLPDAIREVRRLAEMGDFSENAAYQMAKGRLRSMNDSIVEITENLKHAVIIKADKTSETLQIGNTITVEVDGKQRVYLMLGSTQADPSKGIISHNSPLGSVLLGHKVGDSVILKRKDKDVVCKIISID